MRTPRYSDKKVRYRELEDEEADEAIKEYWEMMKDIESRQDEFKRHHRKDKPIK